MIPSSAYDDEKAHALSIRLQSAADGLDTAGDPSSSNWMEGFAEGAYALERELAELREEMNEHRCACVIDPTADKPISECEHHEKIREALVPFVDIYKGHVRTFGELDDSTRISGSQLTVGLFKQAEAALAEQKAP